jgi:N6-L-threonylcarbamoyladenine synthase
MGEAYDKAATILGLPYPGGPNLDRLAQSPGADDRAHDLPVSRLGRGSLDLSFSGLKTAVLYTVRGIPGPGGVFQRDHTALTDAQKADIAASFQRAAVQAIILKLNRALEQAARPQESGPGHPEIWPSGTLPRALLAGGGVISNSRLRAELQAFTREHNLQLRLPEPRFCVDNAAMIAGLAFHLLREGRTSDLSLPAIPTTAC